MLSSVALMCWLATQHISAFGDKWVDIGELMVADRHVDVTGLPPESIAFNPSLVRVSDGDYMVFRVDTTSMGRGAQMMLGIVKLDASLRPQGPATLLDTRLERASTHTSEDPRLVALGDEIYVLFNQVTQDTYPRRGMFIAHIARRTVAAGEQLWAQNVALLDTGEKPRQAEKNWTPFVEDGELRLVYTTNPPLVLTIDANYFAASAPKVLVTQRSRLTHKLPYVWGAMRGGSGAEILPELGSNLSFFHARKRADLGGGKMMRYYIGAYAFAPHAPYQITHLLPHPLFPGASDNPWGPIEVAYPGGYLLGDATVTVAYGLHDHAIRFLTLDRKKLVAALRASPAPLPLMTVPVPQRSRLLLAN